MIPNSSDIDLLGPWAWKLMGASCWSPEGRTALGYVEDGEPKWAMIYDHYEKNSIQMHVAGDHPKYWSRRALQAVFEYPFYQLRVKKVIGIVNSENTRALSIHLRLGWQMEAVVKDVYDMGDMYILSMTQEQCRWLRGNDYGWERERTEAA